MMKNTNSKNKVTANDFFLTLELERMKKEYCFLNEEINRLHSLDVITESGAKKREAIPALETEKKKLEKIYAEKYTILEAWLQSTFSAAEYEANLKILKTYFMSIGKQELQKIINHLYPPNIIPLKNLEARIEPLYRASNLRQQMKLFWRNQVEKQ